MGQVEIDFRRSQTQLTLEPDFLNNNASLVIQMSRSGSHNSSIKISDHFLKNVHRNIKNLQPNDERLQKTTGDSSQQLIFVQNQEQCINRV